MVTTRVRGKRLILVGMENRCILLKSFYHQYRTDPSLFTQRAVYRLPGMLLCTNQLNRECLISWLPILKIVCVYLHLGPEAHLKVD
jgi:hypothetical protein